MMCSSCRRQALATWRTWDARRICATCIRRALREAELAESSRMVVDVLERMRKLGLG